jgi:hypothetical protein
MLTLCYGSGSTGFSVDENGAFLRSGADMSRTFDDMEIRHEISACTYEEPGPGSYGTNWRQMRSPEQQPASLCERQEYSSLVLHKRCRSRLTRATE